MKNKVSFFLKIVVSGVLIYFVIRRVDLREASIALGAADYYLLVLASLIIMAGIVLSAYKWKLIVEASGIYSLSLLEAIRYYAIGNFVSLFLPTSVGGDVFRVYLLNKKVNSRSYSAFSILLERASGLAVMIVAVIVSGVFLYAAGTSAGLSRIVILYILPLASLLLMVIIIMGFLASRVQSGWILHLAERTRVNRLLDYWRSFFGKKGLLSKIFFYSIIFQILAGVFSATIMYSFGIREHISALLLISYVVAFLSSLPISFNGIGVREYAYIVLLGQLGYPLSVTFAIGVASFLIQVVVGIIGLLFYSVTSLKVNECSRSDHYDIQRYPD